MTIALSGWYVFKTHATLSLGTVIDSVIMIWYECTQVMDAGQKLNDISSAIVDNIENHCQCRFIRDRITDEAFQCTDNGLEAVAYAATVHGTASVNSSILIAHIKQWATDGATVVILHEVLNISSMGPINGECCTERTMMKEITTSGSLLNDTQAKLIAKDNNHTLFIILGGGSGGGVVVIVIIIIIIVIGTIVKCKNRKRRKLR